MFYSVKEVANILKISESTVLRLIHDGEIRAIRLGKRIYRIHEASVDFLREVVFGESKYGDY